MKATLKLQQGNHFIGETPSGHVMHWDSGPADSETNGPTPMEAMLHAGAVCSGMDVIAILRKRRKEPTFFEITVEADRADTYPKVFTNYRINYKIGGDNLKYEEVLKAVRLSQEKYCSVINMLKSDVAIDFDIEIV